MHAYEFLQPVADRIIPIAFEVGLGALTDSERNVFLVWSYIGGVENGGHCSLFYNSHGDHAHEMVQALIEIGSTDFAQLLKAAIDTYPNGSVPQDQDERYEILLAMPDSVDAVFSEIDDEFFALNEGDVLMKRLVSYWMVNKS